MQVKVSTFDREMIRSYMNRSSALEKGIAYYKHVNPAISDEQAKELAIREAQDRSHAIWANDSTGYIRNEHMAFSEFEERVEKGSYFSITSYDSAISSGGIFDGIWSFIKKALLWYVIIVVVILIITGISKVL